MVLKKSKQEIAIDAFALIREFDSTLEYMEVRIRRLREKTAEIRNELVKHRPEFVENKIVLPNVKRSLGIIGLMFAMKKPVPHVFKKHWFMGVHSMHSWFMMFPIDILFLDNNNIVVDKTSLKQFSAYTSKAKGIVYAVEAYMGDFKNIDLGDIVLWDDSY